MLNNVILVGKLSKEPEMIDVGNGKKATTITLAIKRNFKNIDGIYDTDFIRCILWDGIVSNTVNYCRVGDTIGVRGRLQESKYEDENKTAHYSIDIIAERVSFLATKTYNKENEDRDER